MFEGVGTAEVNELILIAPDEVKPNILLNKVREAKNAMRKSKPPGCDHVEVEVASLIVNGFCAEYFRGTRQW